ncbi:M73 family metallopeptidase [Nocardioides terrigena]|uniref:hypothetical protein n=1 Tax=Nocardioides terrigena TaxID=424797 RepID=UPI000D3102DD|nr:hypothetical protein [Nocardioides terrigena]
MRLRDEPLLHVLGSVRVRAVLALGILVAPLGVNTMAYWSSRVVLAPGTVQAGTLDLTVNGANSLAEAGLTVGNMAPGATTAAVFTVRNASAGGNAVLTYTVHATAADAAPAGTSAALVAKVTTASTVTTSGTNKTCGGTVVTTAATFNGPLVAAPRELGVGASQTLCVQASLAADAPAGGRSTITMTFKAVQKNPNP